MRYEYFAMLIAMVCNSVLFSVYLTSFALGPKCSNQACPAKLTAIAICEGMN